MALSRLAKSGVAVFLLYITPQISHNLPNSFLFVLNVKMFTEWVRALQTAEDDENVRFIVITGRWLVNNILQQKLVV